MMFLEMNNKIRVGTNSMIKFNQVIKISFMSIYSVSNEPEVCLIGIGNYNGNNFIYKTINGNNENFQSKKYLKKTDKKEISEALRTLQHDDILEEIDLTHIGNLKAKDEIEEKWLDLLAIYKQM